MRKTLIKQLVSSAKNAQSEIKTFTPKQKSQMERAWDIEHAYYSSTLEGSKLDRKEFEKFGKKVK